MNHIDIVYQAIKTHNTTNPKSPNTLVPAYTGDIIKITNLQLEEIKMALETLIQQGHIRYNNPVLSKERDNYGEVISYGELFAI